MPVQLPARIPRMIAPAGPDTAQCDPIDPKITGNPEDAVAVMTIGICEMYLSESGSKVNACDSMLRKQTCTFRV